MKLNERQQRIVDGVAERIVRYRAELPAQFMLESMRPLNFVGSQALVFFQPLLGAFLNPQDLTEMAELLEHRSSIDAIIDAIEKKSLMQNRKHPAKDVPQDG